MLNCSGDRKMNQFWTSSWQNEIGTVNGYRPKMVARKWTRISVSQLWVMVSCCFDIPTSCDRVLTFQSIDCENLCPPTDEPQYNWPSFNILNFISGLVGYLPCGAKTQKKQTNTCHQENNPSAHKWRIYRDEAVYFVCRNINVCLFGGFSLVCWMNVGHEIGFPGLVLSRTERCDNHRKWGIPSVLSSDAPRRIC